MGDKLFCYLFLMCVVFGGLSSISSLESYKLSIIVSMDVEAAHGCTEATYRIDRTEEEQTTPFAEQNLLSYETYRASRLRLDEKQRLDRLSSVSDPHTNRARRIPSSMSPEYTVASERVSFRQADLPNAGITGSTEREGPEGFSSETRPERKSCRSSEYSRITGNRVSLAEPVIAEDERVKITVRRSFRVPLRLD